MLKEYKGGRHRNKERCRKQSRNLYWPSVCHWSHFEQRAGGKTPLTLHVGQLKLSAEACMQKAHTRDCIHTSKPAGAYIIQLKVKSTLLLRPGIVMSLLDSVLQL